METNEVSKNAKGGTELMMEGLYKNVDNDLLDQFQIIPSRVRDLDPDKKKIYWLHDLPGDPEVQHLKDGGWEKFDRLIFVSNWQQEMYNIKLGVPYSAGTVLKNAIVPLPEANPEDDKIRLIYTSTPHRGLEILYPVFKTLKEKYKNIHLDVFSSFELYGWKQRDKPFEELFDQLRNDPDVTYHGAKSNDEVRKALTKSHIFVLPSIWQETSCLSLIEAMSAGLTCVHSSYGALPETSLSLNFMYGFHENPNFHAVLLGNVLDSILENKLLLETIHAKPFIDEIYNWEERAFQWQVLLEALTKV